MTKAEYNKDYYYKHREHRIKGQKRYNNLHKEERLEYQRRYRQKIKEALNL